MVYLASQVVLGEMNLYFSLILNLYFLPFRSLCKDQAARQKREEDWEEEENLSEDGKPEPLLQ